MVVGAAQAPQLPASAPASARHAVERMTLCRRYLKDEDLRHIAALHLMKIGGRENLGPLIDYLLAGGAARNREIVTALGNTMQHGNIGGAARSAIVKCMKTLAARGDEEAAAVL
jgi:hypothetical protein